MVTQDEPVRCESMRGNTLTTRTSRNDAELRNVSDIVDVAVRGLNPISDVRGSLSEIHRDEWRLGPRPVQWDFVVSNSNVLRGVHVHCLRWDYIVALEGCGALGLKDLRRDLTSFGRSMLIDVTGGQPTIVTIPPGVAHGIYARGTFRYLYGLTVAWDGTDENLGCRYDDPELAIKWPSTAPSVLQRDLDLPDFATLLRQYESLVRDHAKPATTFA
jgi:dTDP-4-dehydrorhamnose 3,5-epimerase